MKKIILIILITLFFGNFTSAQKLLDLYKNGPVMLIPEKTYGDSNNWASLFNLYYDTLNIREQEREKYKKIVVAPDGSVFMSHKNRYEIWKFGPDGTFLKRFGTKGGKAYQFPYLPSVEPIVDGKYLFTTDANARLKFFDLEGNYFKSITLDYMAGNFQPIGNGDIILEGNVMWKKTDPKYVTYDTRHIIVNLNLYSGEEKIVYSVFEHRDTKYYNTANRDSMLMMPVNSSEDLIYLPGFLDFKKPVFTLLKDGQFLLSNRENGLVKVFDKTGKEKYSFKLDISPVKITEQDVLENFGEMKQSYLEMIDNINKNNLISEDQKRMNTDQLQKMLDRADRYKDISNYFPYLPYFSNIIVDSEGNLLVFEFTNEDDEAGNIFNVVAYDNTGRIMARTSFICEDYDLSFSENTFVISNGYVYAVAQLRNIKGMPLRLVKFKMTN